MSSREYNNSKQMVRYTKYTKEGKAFVNIFFLVTYKLGITLGKTVTFFTGAKNKNDKPSTLQRHHT